MLKHGTAYSNEQFSQVSAGITLALPTALKGTEPKTIIAAMQNNGALLTKILKAALTKLQEQLVLKKITEVTFNGKKIERYDLVENANFGKILASTFPSVFNADGSVENKKLACQLCTQNYRQFCNEHRDQLSTTGINFFLVEEDGELFFTYAYVGLGGLIFFRKSLDDSYGWSAGDDPRFFFQQLA